MTKHYSRYTVHDPLYRTFPFFFLLPRCGTHLSTPIRLTDSHTTCLLTLPCPFPPPSFTCLEYRVIARALPLLPRDKLPPLPPSPCRSRSSSLFPFDHLLYFGVLPGFSPFFSPSTASQFRFLTVASPGPPFFLLACTTPLRLYHSWGRAPFPASLCPFPKCFCPSFRFIPHCKFILFSLGATVCHAAHSPLSSFRLLRVAAVPTSDLPVSFPPPLFAFISTSLHSRLSNSLFLL